ncbi:MAG TPA: HEAT repeat domain-containing protein [Armatimonadota bacterium]|nr:HEAT repeat domain-containing protein [Armatimonadota bacterium]
MNGSRIKSVAVVVGAGMLLGLAAVHGQAGGGGGSVTQEIHSLLNDPKPDTEQGALDWLLRSDQSRDLSLSGPLLTLAESKDPAVRERAVRNLGWVIQDGKNEKAIQEVLKAFGGSNTDVRQAAFDVIRDSANAGGPMASWPATESAMATALRSGDPDTRSKAADILILLKAKGIGDKAAIDRDLRPALAINDRSLQEKVAPVLGVKLPPLPAPPTPPVIAAGFKVDSHFDYGYFVAYVLPQLTSPNKNANGQACVSCHYDGNKTVGDFFLIPPDRDGHFTLEQAHENYSRVVAAINKANPLDSVFLLKGLNNRVLDGRSGMDHGGGVFWLNDKAVGYQLIAGWLNGDKFDAPIQNIRSFETYVKDVTPILVKRGDDNDACVTCHATHAVLNLIPPAAGGVFTADQLRHNYESLTRIIDPDHPEATLFLHKPTWDKDGANGQSHAGGKRWPAGTASPEYHKMLAWVQDRVIQ